MLKDQTNETLSSWMARLKPVLGAVLLLTFFLMVTGHNRGAELRTLPLSKPTFWF